MSWVTWSMMIREIRSEKRRRKTIAANHKAEKIKETFKEWVWTDAYRTQDLENIYNSKYNTERARTYDGSHLFLQE